MFQLQLSLLSFFSFFFFFFFYFSSQKPLIFSFQLLLSYGLINLKATWVKRDYFLLAPSDKYQAHMSKRSRQQGLRNFGLRNCSGHADVDLQISYWGDNVQMRINGMFSINNFQFLNNTIRIFIYFFTYTYFYTCFYTTNFYISGPHE